MTGPHHAAWQCAASKEGLPMRLLLRGALTQPATVGSQTMNLAIAAALTYVVEAIPVIAKMAITGELQLPKTLTIWLLALSPFVIGLLSIVIAVLRGQPLPQPEPTPQPPAPPSA